MTTRTQEFVLEFHETYGSAIRTTPNVDVPEKAMRIELIREELVDELIPAIKVADLVEIADALGDLEYVIFGAAITFGLELNEVEANPSQASVKIIEDGLALLITALENNSSGDTLLALMWLQIAVRNLAAYMEIPLDDVIEVIHESNMSKLGEDGKPIYREDGKVLKGPNFFTPTEKIIDVLGLDAGVL